MVVVMIILELLVTDQPPLIPGLLSPPIKKIGGQPRTGESADTSKLDKWHPGTVRARAVVGANYNSPTGAQTTYVRNIRFYVE